MEIVILKVLVELTFNKVYIFSTEQEHKQKHLTHFVLCIFYSFDIPLKMTFSCFF